MDVGVVKFDVTGVVKLMETLIKEYEKAEIHAILFFSTDITRDFKLLDERVKLYKDKLGKLLSNGGNTDIKQVGVSLGEEDLQKESV
jgi:hypothetical protein